MYPGELGCYASHYAAWTAFLESEADQLLVLEDDTIVDWGFLEKLVAVDLDAAGVAYLRLYAKRACAFRTILRNAIERQRSVIEFLDRPLGTQGYVLTRAGAGRWCLIAAESAGRSTTSSIAPGTMGSGPSASFPFR